MRVRDAVRWAGRHKRLWLALIVGAVAAVLLSDALAPRIDSALQHSEAILRGHAVLGKVLFTLLAVASPLLAFFSSAVLVPVATSAWGAPTTVLLLWLGWIGGGVMAYSIARFLGRAVVHRLASAQKLNYYEERVSSDVRWWMLLLLQLALPSEIPGYLCGLLRIRFRFYLAAVALGELPYAIGTVSLGEAFLARNPLVFAAVALAGLALLTTAYRVLHNQLARHRTPTDTASASTASASTASASTPSAPTPSAPAASAPTPSGPTASARGDERAAKGAAEGAGDGERERTDQRTRPAPA